MKRILLIFLFFCNSVYSEEYLQASNEFVEKTIDLIINNYHEDSWYGLYYLDKISGDQFKIGYAKINYNISINEKLEKTFSENFFLKGIFKINEDEFHTESLHSYVYNAKPPYNLIYGFDSSISDDGTSFYEVYNVENGKSKYSLMEDNEYQEKVIDNFTFSLKDHFAPFYALDQKVVKPGKKFNTKWLDLGEETISINEIKEISTTNIFGSTYEYGKFESLQKFDGIEELIEYYLAPDRLINLIISDSETIKIEMRLESESDAKNLELVKDLFILSSIEIDNGTLGLTPFDIRDREVEEFGSNYHEHHQMVYEIVGEYTNIFDENYYNQKVFKDGDKTFIMIGDYGFDIREKVDQKYYAEAEIYKENNPTLNEMANNITAWAVNDDEVLDDLLYHMENYNYVNRMIEITNPYQIIEYGGGDCTEISDLFISLVKSLGIPARRVFGYARQGDSFGGHQWAEVAYNGEWWAVDPTWLMWTDFSKDHLKINDRNDIGNAPFKIRVSEINIHLKDFSVIFTKEGEIIYR